jgi:hypothetical protein
MGLPLACGAISGRKSWFSADSGGNTVDSPECGKKGEGLTGVRGRVYRSIWFEQVFE